MYTVAGPYSRVPCRPEYDVISSSFSDMGEGDRFEMRELMVFHQLFFNLFIWRCVVWISFVNTRRIFDFIVIMAHFTSLFTVNIIYNIAEKRDWSSLMGRKKLRLSLFSTILYDISPCDGIVCFQHSVRAVSMKQIAHETNLGWRYIAYSHIAEHGRLSLLVLSQTFKVFIQDVCCLRILFINLIKTLFLKNNQIVIHFKNK